MKTVGAYEAKTHFSELFDQVKNGQAINISRHGTPIAILSPYIQERHTPTKEVIEPALLL